MMHVYEKIKIIAKAGYVTSYSCMMIGLIRLSMDILLKIIKLNINLSN